MGSVPGAGNDKGSSQSQQHDSTTHENPGRVSAMRQGSQTSGPQGSVPSRLQSVWEPAQAYSRQNQQQVNSGYMPGPQPAWPPGTLPYMQPQVFMYPGLPGNPPAFYPAQSLHGAQRPIPQMMPQMNMMMPPQQYSGVNTMFPFGVAPSATPEQWLQARNIRQPAAMFQGVRPMGWGGVPFQQPPNDLRWQLTPKPVAASMPSQRPARPFQQQQQQQQQQQPPPPPPRTASFPQLSQLNRQMSMTSLGPPVSESQPASRSSSTSAISRSAVQTDKPEQEASAQNAADAAEPAVGKVPCAFFLKTGTCAYGDKCKFEHPWDKLPVVRFNSMGLPLRQGQPECAYYLRHGRCGFGPSCKFHHPEPGKAGSNASQEEGTATAGSAAVPADTAGSIDTGTAEALPESTPPSQPQVLAVEQQQEAAACTSAQTAPTGASSLPAAQSQPALQTAPQFLMPQPQYFMTAGQASSIPAVEAQVPQLGAQPQLQPQLGAINQSSSVPQVQPAAAALQPLQSQPQTVISSLQSQMPQHATPLEAQLRTNAAPQSMAQAAVSAQAPGDAQIHAASHAQLQAQLQAQPQVATAVLPTVTLQQPQGTPVVAEQPAHASTTGGPQLPPPAASATSAFLPMSSVAMQPQFPTLQAPVAFSGAPRQQRQPPRRSASVPEGSMVAMQSSSPLPGQSPVPSPVGSIPIGRVPVMQPQLQPQPQPQELVAQPQQLTAQPQQLVAQPQQLIAQPQQLITQPQQLMAQPQQLVAQPDLQGQQQGAFLQSVPAAQAAAGALLPQQQPVLLAQAGQVVQPGQQMAGQNQMTASQNGAPVQYSLPAQPMLPAHAIAAQAVPLLVPSQQYQLSPSQGLPVQVSPMAGLTPLEQVPKQASSPPGKAGDGKPLEDMSAGLPSLHLTGSNDTSGLEGLSGDDVLKPLGHYDSEELAAPSLNTPAPSERSLATASTMSTSTSLISSNPSSSDTAKAIEAVRQSLDSKQEAKGGTLERSSMQAQTKH